MKNYLFTMLFVSFITGALTYLSSGSFYEKQLRYLSILLTLIALISPLPALIQGYQAQLPTFTVPECGTSQYGTLLKSKTEQRLNEQLSRQICSSCGLDQEEFQIDTVLTLDEESSVFSMDTVKVELYSLKAIAQREQMRTIISQVSAQCTFKEILSQKQEEEKANA